MKRILCFAVLLVALGASGCTRSGASDEQNKQEPPKNVRVLVIARGDLHEYINLTGPLRPVRATDLSTQESGTVESIPHDKGSEVKEGETIVLLDRDLLAAQLESAKADCQLKAYNEDRTRSLYEDNSVSKQEMLLAHTQLTQAEAARDVARIRYERSAIKAPYDGVVTDRFVDPGALVIVGQKVARLVDPYTLKLEGGVTEREIAYLTVGAPALVSFEGDTAKAKGRVGWVGLEASPDAGKFKVEIEIDNPQLRFRPGVVGSARVNKRVYHDAIVVPRDALVHHPGGLVAFVVKGERAEQREITLGPGEGAMVIAQSGLAEGDTLVVRGQRDLVDGSRVAIQERSTSPDGSLPSDPGVVQEQAQR
jgi:membrane fusion protein (multidrug efflux system)